MLLAGIKSKHPAKALPQSITAIYPVCHVACKKSSKAGVPPLLPEGNRYADKKHSPWDGLKICQFAFLRKGRSLPRSTLCSSLPPLHKKFAWHGEALVPPGNG